MIKNSGIEPNEWIRGIHRVTEHLGDRRDYISLDRNERVPSFEGAVFQEMVATLDPTCLTEYPDSSPLYNALSSHLGIGREHLLLTTGSDSGIKAMMQVYLGPGEKVVMTDPTYAMYPIYTKMFGGIPIEVRYGNDLTLDSEVVIDHLDDKPRILALCNPDQPTGSVIDPSVLNHILKRAEEMGVLVIVDEAYYPFYPKTAAVFLDDFPNLAVLRTFSKVGGLAGLRLGYVMAAPDIINNLYKVRSAYDVNSPTIRLTTYLLEHPFLMDEYLKEVKEGRRVVERGLERMGLPRLPSHGNFQVVKLPPTVNAGSVVDGLYEERYIVKGPFTTPSLENSFRVSLGSPEVMAGFLQALELVLHRQHSDN